MEIQKKKYLIHGRYCLYVRVSLSPDEKKMAYIGGLQSCQIQTKQSFLTPLRFSQLLNRVRNRWSVAILRSSGYVFFDTVSRGFIKVFSIMKQILRGFFGTRTRFSDLLQGVEFRARSLEDLRETEVFVFASIAAVHNAIDFMADSGEVEVYQDRSYIKEIAGLSFAGATLIGTRAGVVDRATRMYDVDSSEEADFDDDVDFDSDELGDFSAEGMEI